MKWKNKQKGITLVALVVTIIILLILAGITISQLTGSGLFTKAQQAATETKYANAAEKVATVYAVSIGNGETIPIPYGFYYIGGNLKTGVVISDNPADKYDGKTDKIAHSYATQLKGNQFVWIPCSIDNYKKINWGKENGKWDMETNIAEYEQIEKYGGFYVGRYEAGVSTLNETTGNIVEKANSIPYYHSDYYTAVEMTRRMYKNDTERNKYVTSGLVTGTQWDMIIKYIQDEGTNVSSSDWGNYNDTSLKDLRGYYTNVTTSGETDGFKSVTDATAPLASSETRKSGYAYVLLTTGSTAQVMKRKLYDIAGNLCEWTQETAYIKDLYYSSDETYNSYMLRGGSFGNDYASYSACSRGYSCATATSTHYGFRATLYIL